MASSWNKGIFLVCFYRREEYPFRGRTVEQSCLGEAVGNDEVDQ
jgi:hypothetical protein